MRVGRGRRWTNRCRFCMLFISIFLSVFVWLYTHVFVCLYLCICICVCTCTSVITMRIMRVGGRRRWTNRGGRWLMCHATQLSACLCDCEATAAPCDLWWWACDLTCTQELLSYVSWVEELFYVRQLPDVTYAEELLAPHWLMLHATQLPVCVWLWGNCAMWPMIGNSSPPPLPCDPTYTALRNYYVEELPVWDICSIRPTLRNCYLCHVTSGTPRLCKLGRGAHRLYCVS